mgnify:CR=1 FL=1
MNCDELLNVPEIVITPDDAGHLMNKKERLYSLAACGKTKQYLGVELSWEQVQQMSGQDIEKYHSRYEAQLGSRMVKSIGHTVLGIYAKVVSRFAPIDSEQDFMYDLSQDPVLTKSLESIGCDLYYRFGTLLAPLIAGLITFNHIDFNFIKNERDGKSRQSDEPEPTNDPTNDPTSD